MGYRERLSFPIRRSSDLMILVALSAAASTFGGTSGLLWMMNWLKGDRIPRGPGPGVQPILPAPPRGGSLALWRHVRPSLDDELAERRPNPFRVRTPPDAHPQELAVDCDCLRT